MHQLGAVHISLPSATVWVDQAIFYNLTTPSCWVKAKLFGLTCLPGRVPTFEILTAEGYVFSDIPPHMVRWKANDVVDPLPLESLVYNNCLSESFSLNIFDELKNRKAFAYFRHHDLYMAADYWFSLDFYKDNNWYHCVKLENGQIAFIPSHKLIFTPDGKLPENHAFPPYQKLRLEFKV